MKIIILVISLILNFVSISGQDFFINMKPITEVKTLKYKYKDDSYFNGTKNIAFYEVKRFLKPKKYKYPFFININDTITINKNHYSQFSFGSSTIKDFNGYIRFNDNKVYFLNKHYNDTISFIKLQHSDRSKECVLFDFNLMNSNSWITYYTGELDLYEMNLDTTIINQKFNDTIFFFNSKCLLHNDVFDHPIDIVIRRIFVSKTKGILFVEFYSRALTFVLYATSKNRYKRIWLKYIEPYIAKKNEKLPQLGVACATTN